MIESILSHVLPRNLTGKVDYQSGKGVPGSSKLYIDDNAVGQGDVPLTMAVMIGLAAGFVCGADTDSPVWDKYKPPFPFTGTIDKLTVKLVSLTAEREISSRLRRP
jgi:hypothetical protein